MARTVPRLSILAAALALSACAHSPVNHPSDPLEPVNRAFFAFNDGLDEYIAHPIAEFYVKTVPEPAQDGIDNFVGNATYLTTIVNDFLQGKIVQGFSDVARLGFNTIVGIGGLVDAATMIGLEEHDEDFGQTFGYWGIGNGIFITLPFIGPTTGRDLVGSIGNIIVDPTTYLPFRYAMPITAGDVLNTRAELLSADGVLAQQFDKYIFIRNAYLQHRENLVYDGSPPIVDEFGDMDMEADASSSTSSPSSASAPISEAPEAESADPAPRVAE